MLKNFNIIQYKKIAISVFVALLFWFGILLFGVINTDKNMYFSYLPSNVEIYLNIENNIETLDGIRRYDNLLRNYSTEISYNTIKDVVSKFQGNFVIVGYKNTENKNKILFIGRKKEGVSEQLNQNWLKHVLLDKNILIFSTDKNYYVDHSVDSTQEVWQKDLISLNNASIYMYLSQAIHNNNNLGDLVGTIKFIDDLLQFHMNSIDKQLLGEVEEISNIIIPQNYKYSIYLDKNSESRQLLYNLDYQLFEILGTYIDNPAYDVMANFNSFSGKEQEYQVTLINTQQQDLYNQLTEYIIKQVAYLYPIIEERELEDGTVIKEMFADKNFHIATRDQNQLVINNEKDDVWFEFQRDGNNIIIRNFIKDSQRKTIMLSEIQERCQLRTKYYPFLFHNMNTYLKTKDTDKLLDEKKESKNDKKNIEKRLIIENQIQNIILNQYNIFIQNTGYKLEGCLYSGKE